MKKSAKITLCALSAALAAVFMLTSYFPYLTYAIPAIAGLVMLIPLIEIGVPYAFLSFLVSALIVLISAESEAAAVYISLLGYYPILKALIERLKSRLMEWIIKIAVLNSALFIIYALSTFIFKIPVENMGSLEKYAGIILIALCNIVFVIYDIALARLAGMYIMRIQPIIRKIIKH